MSSNSVEVEPDVQRNVQADAPSADAQASGASFIKCLRCDWTGPDVTRCPRCGRFLPGNEAALVHGGRRLQERGPADVLQQARQDEVRTGLLTDLGDTPSTAKGIVINRLVETTLLAEVTWQDIKARGAFTGRGRRRAVVDLYLAASDRAARLAQVLGLERKPKDALTLDAYLQSRYGSQDGPGAAADSQGGDAGDRHSDAECTALVAHAVGDKE